MKIPTDEAAVREKIKSLLTLASDGSTTQAERDNARRQAHRLIDKHGIGGATPEPASTSSGEVMTLTRSCPHCHQQVQTPAGKWHRATVLKPCKHCGLSYATNPHSNQLDGVVVVNCDCGGAKANGTVHCAMWTRGSSKDLCRCRHGVEHEILSDGSVFATHSGYRQVMSGCPQCGCKTPLHDYLSYDDDYECATCGQHFNRRRRRVA